MFPVFLAMPWAPCQVLHTARASSQAHKKPHSCHTGHRSKGLGQQWSQALSLSKAWELLSLCLHLCLRANNPKLGQLEFKNRLRHMLNSQSRQILRLFLKIVPLLLWHSCLELSVSGPIYKPPFNWQSWCKQEVPAKIVGLLSSMSISLPEQEPHN